MKSAPNQTRREAAHHTAHPRQFSIRVSLYVDPAGWCVWAAVAKDPKLRALKQLLHRDPCLGWFLFVFGLRPAGTHAESSMLPHPVQRLRQRVHRQGPPLQLPPSPWLRRPSREVLGHPSPPALVQEAAAAGYTAAASNPRRTAPHMRSLAEGRWHCRPSTPRIL